jgi:hypothetical protein
LVKIVVFSAKEAVFGIWHHAIGLKRQLCRLPIDRFLKSSEMLPELDISGQPKRCKHCGYALIEIKTSNGWLVSACSATAVLQTLKQRGALELLEQINGTNE